MTASPTPFAEGAATCAKNAQVQPASAAMPSEEDFTKLAVGWMAEGRYVASEVVAKRIYALFAPILAEKERVEREWTSEKERADMAAAQMVKQNDRVRELVALLDKQLGSPCEQIRHRQEVENLEARALAAEAALAAERERCAKLADDNADNDSRGDCPWDGGAGGMGYRLACYDIAAAIRAQG